MSNAATALVEVPSLFVQAYAIGEQTNATVTVEHVKHVGGDTPLRSRLRRGAETKVTFQDGYSLTFVGRMSKREARSQAVAQRFLKTFRRATAANDSI